jgi:N-acetyl-alpha-D-muramate 1-phosphate uridylyltransferase
VRHCPFPLMLFAAGFGTRMGALTRHQPKPLIPVAGRALIDHALALAEEAGTARTVVNLHYKGDMIRAHLAGRAIAFADESPDILEKGGGLRAALPLLGPGPVATLNTDAVWTGANPLTTLADGWRPDMGALLLLAPLERARGHSGKGDFALHPDGRITRGGNLVYLGAQIIDPEGLDRIAERAFSLNRHWDALIAQGRAFGTLHAGQWCDVGRPEGIAEAEAMLHEASHV